MTQHSPDARLSIQDLPSIVMLLFERSHSPLAPASQGQLGLCVRYLRRKPGRGLAVIYSLDDVHPAGRHALGARSRHPGRVVSLTVDEQALDGAYLRCSAAQAQRAPVDVQPSGVVRVKDVGLSVQAFPADGRLPALAASCDTAEHGPLFQALQSAARTQLGDDAWRLVSARAAPMRYKPASRCVLRYELTLEHRHPATSNKASRRHLVMFGKLYADQSQARSVYALMQRLYDEQTSRPGGAAAGQTGHLPLLPRPLGMIDALGLTFGEAVQPTDVGEQVISGLRALRPQLVRGRGGAIADVAIPGEELRLTAIALTRLHTSRACPRESTPRTGAHEATRVRERAARIAAGNPAQAEHVVRLAEQLAARLEAVPPDTYRPTHGGFKPSQLLFQGRHVFVVDFDGFGLADPALDVGYFLTYLRPSALWYRRPGMRQWFEAAAGAFASAYRQAMRDHGLTQAAIDGIVARSRLYEAALVFKIATRRVNRLNSPRPRELSAMLDEIAACLADDARRS